MKNKAQIIFLIIILSIIIFSLVMSLVVYLCRGIMGISSKNNKEIFNQTYELKDIKKIDIKQDTDKVIFKESTDNNIQVIAYGNNENDIKVGVSNNQLIIDYTKPYRFEFFNLLRIQNDIVIYIPSSYSNEIRIRNDLGDCEVIDLENATLDINCDAGDVEVGKIRNANIRCDLGKVRIKEILNKCDIEVDSGDIKIEKLLIKEDSKLKVDLGNVNINETSDIYIDANVNLGNTNINKSNRNASVTLKVECDCGNIDINNK